ncbi:hypothetical protein DPEC_G00254400 [Dallia pectoralis]|uniref:Uncharacterized protein n=1 Tax=Dallia pectoralis TaxID=75939 RepID=A0ACC2FU30_DALPE|nr:hypothetical protein DPEC_G00254400 [Dallia pectoralis]
MAEEEVTPGGESPLVTVTFQRNPCQNKKYLESEPKALGVTQITFSVFHICSVMVMLANNMDMLSIDLTQIIGSVIVIIAGILALAAQSLHIPTLKACYGMQIVASSVSIFKLYISVMEIADTPYFCSPHTYNSSDVEHQCQAFEASTSHFYAEWILIHTVLIAVSITLAVYCGKVVNCCFPSEQIPMITVQGPPTQ